MYFNFDVIKKLHRTHTKDTPTETKRQVMKNNKGNTSNRDHNKSHKHTDNRQKTTNSERKEKPYKDRNEETDNRTEGSS